MPKWLALAYIKTVFGCSMRPHVAGGVGPQVRMCRGVRQGRTDSMRLFCSILCYVLQPKLEQWTRSSYGLLISSARLIALAYADDV
eukprot:8625535-Karenia_brevis.AAC.1